VIWAEADVTLTPIVARVGRTGGDVDSGRRSNRGEEGKEKQRETKENKWKSEKVTGGEGRMRKRRGERGCGNDEGSHDDSGDEGWGRMEE
jgi:hypothetical protein